MTEEITEAKTAPPSVPALGTTSLQNEITDLQGSTKETSQSLSQGSLNPTTQENTLQGGSKASTVPSGSQGTMSGTTTDAIIAKTGNYQNAL